MAQVVRFWTIKSDHSDDQIFEAKNGMTSKFKMSSTTASSSSRTIDELDGDTVSCIAAFLRARRVVGESLRGQIPVGWRGHGRA